MAKKVLGKSRKIKELTRYLGDVGVYDLSKPLKTPNGKVDFLVIAKAKPVSGAQTITVWTSDDENGVPLTSTPIQIVKSTEISDVLMNLGYILLT